LADTPASRATSRTPSGASVPINTRSTASVPGGSITAAGRPISTAPDCTLRKDTRHLLGDSRSCVPGHGQAAMRRGPGGGEVQARDGALRAAVK
jgi:hypothetical protein